MNQLSIISCDSMCAGVHVSVMDFGATSSSSGKKECNSSLF